MRVKLLFFLLVGIHMGIAAQCIDVAYEIRDTSKSRLVDEFIATTGGLFFSTSFCEYPMFKCGSVSGSLEQIVYDYTFYSFNEADFSLPSRATDFFTFNDALCVISGFSPYDNKFTVGLSSVSKDISSTAAILADSPATFFIVSALTQFGITKKYDSAEDTDIQKDYKVVFEILSGLSQIVENEFTIFPTVRGNIIKTQTAEVTERIECINPDEHCVYKAENVLEQIKAFTRKGNLYIKSMDRYQDSYSLVSNDYNINC